MTALLTIEKEPRPEESKVTISRRAVMVDGAVSNLEVGDNTGLKILFILLC